MCKPVYYALHEDECTALMSYKFWFNAKKKETKFQVGTQYKKYYLTRIGYDYMTIFGLGSIIVNIVIHTLQFSIQMYFIWSIVFHLDQFNSKCLSSSNTNMAKQKK